MLANLYRALFIVPFAMQGGAFALYAADERISGFTTDDTLTIQAEQAQMDEQNDVIHFEGGFELRANDWYLSSDQASLYGKLDDPETVVITGSPAVIGITAVIRGHASMVDGKATRIVYERNSNTIRMEGNASLSRAGHTLDGGEIVYDIVKDTLSAGGRGGIHIRVNPDEQE